MADTFTTPQGRKIAYNLTAGIGPTVVFLGGYKSDMTGTKAVFLEDWAKAQGRAFLRFDYSGHGESSEAFEDGCIGDWFEDTCAVLGLIDGPLVLVGSSMGGWISLLVAREMPERVAGLVGIAAAPDFTEDGFWADFTEAEKAQLVKEGRVAVASEYGDPYIVTKRLIEDGRERLVMHAPLSLPFRVRFLVGTQDTTFIKAQAVGLMDHATSPDMQMKMVKWADHSFSSAECLEMIVTAIDEVSTR